VKEKINKVFLYRSKMGCLALAVAVFAGLFGVAWVQAGPPYDNHTGLVVDYADGTVQTFCLELANADQYFGNDNGVVTGDEVLRASGLPLEESGGLVCQIGEVGCPADDCFCQCSGTPCLYWQYWHLQPGGSAWQFSGVGSNAYEVSPEEVEGWGWAVEPELNTFNDICGFDPADDTPPSFPANDPLTGTPLITPTLGVTLTTQRPSFDWTEAEDDIAVFQYTLIITGPAGTDHILTMQSAYSAAADWLPGVYSWTVQAQDAAGNVSPSLSLQTFELVTATVEPVVDEKLFLPLILKND
jgi:hypothetical protein